MHWAPVDLSFKSLNNVEDALNVEPNQRQQELRRGKDGTFCSRIVRLSNNNISELTGLINTVSVLLSQPAQLAWLDLSFNKISRIDPMLTELQQLRVLYLHGNSIVRLCEVDKLGSLPFLHTITLHGNSVENKCGYRGYVIANLLHLKSMDFNGITKQERLMASLQHKRRNLHKLTSSSL
ncbi:leucine-rich repeat-containing protein 51 [Denticeps clupeoides]|uniref:Leucine-rich repeat-containing protein 51 n=1 Tax=Denticeps clupeoides TaxID=299321 RepID=A0AAY4DBZ3_9TELE|nr:leucine-rich repeat-containing protein 51-like [Denticeps clupeoides]